MSAILGVFLTSLITFITIYTFASLGGLISEKSGIVNIAIDGKMIIGALVFTSLLNSREFTSSLGIYAPYLAILISGLITALYSTIFSIAVINFMSDQVIAGTAINMISPAISLLIMKSVFSTENLTFVDPSAGWAGTINTVSIVMLIVSLFVIFLSWFLINKTKYGLRMKSSGENPYSLETSGISVKKTRWISLTISGFLIGIAGSLFPIALGAGTFSGSVNGSGFISIAIIVVGQWKVLGIFIVSLIFSLLTSVASIWSIFGTNFPSELINIIPFITPLIVLIIIKSSSSPRWVGKVYNKNMR